MKNLQAFEKTLKQFEALFGYTPKNLKAVRCFLPKTKVMVVSPHPDDEILSGGLALRLQAENRCHVINIAVTLGSDPSRKTARRKELAKAVSFLKWDNYVLPENWSEKEQKLVALLKKERPSLIIAPHKNDYHPTHIRTSELLSRAIAKSRVDTQVAWAEYWSPQERPNLMIGLSRESLMKQVHALTFHKGEVARNPYHLLLPAWQMDSVRRGSEWLAGKGARGASFVFGQLYRLEKFQTGRPIRQPASATIMGLSSDLGELLVK